MRQSEYALMHQQEMVHWWFRGRRVLLERLLARHLPRGSSSGPRILDFGCGTGGNAIVYAALGEVVGVEPDQSALRFAASRHSPVSYCRAVGTLLPFAARSFDAVVASDVLEHIADDGAAVSEIARVLRPRGVLIFTVPAHPWLWSRHDEALWHQRRYRRDMLIRVLRSGGLEVRWLSYWNAVLFPVVALHRVCSRGDRGAAPVSDVRLPAPAVNRALYGVLQLEAMALRWIRFPLGVSLVGVAGAIRH